MARHRTKLGDRHVPIAEDDGLARGDAGKIPREVGLGRVNVNLDHDRIVNLVYD
jgi:hypothetical protein